MTLTSLCGAFIYKEDAESFIPILWRLRSCEPFILFWATFQYLFSWQASRFPVLQMGILSMMGHRQRRRLSSNSKATLSEPMAKSLLAIAVREKTYRLNSRGAVRLRAPKASLSFYTTLTHPIRGDTPIGSYLISQPTLRILLRTSRSRRISGRRNSGEKRQRRYWLPGALPAVRKSS